MSVHEVALKKAENIEGLKDILPDFAKDIRLNLSAVVKEDSNSGLTLNQVYGTALASAYATRNGTVIQAITGEVSAVLSAEEINAAKAAATIMGMNNVYYRAIHMIEDAELGKMPAGLRMNVISNPGVDKATFELFEMAVSAINGCGGCLQAHARGIENAGLSKAAVQHSLKIAAVISAAAQALSI
jgi:alkyl hydroperoxide reductase subunit D